ncbi:MAG: DivIVA domain-containing protein [Clostridia bacterium]|nr:DivIVA domain-containing protein [Clostridia bacterium]
MYSPLELEQIEFEKKAFGGYSVEDVDKTFDTLKKDYSKLYIEHADMKKRIKELEAKLAESEGITETLRDVLVSAQKSSDELRENARIEADLMRKTAEAEAKEILRGADDEIESLKRKKEDLENEVKLFITKMSALFEAQVKYLNNAE